MYVNGESGGNGHHNAKF